ncbi:MAG: MgtC/SapB family protein [Candidatus Woesearchaeota archaeon]
MSFIFGLERQRTHKPVGFGTFIFVAVSSCALSITAFSIFVENPLPLLSAIVTGIGFLGAGALIRTTDKIFGFTTASSIWSFAILGLIIGAGMYFIGIILYVYIWIVVLFDKYLETKGIGSYKKKVIITSNKIVNSDEINKILFNSLANYNLLNMEADKKDSRYSYSYFIEGTKEDINKNLKILFGKDWCSSIKIE